MKNTKKLSMLLLVVMAPTALEAATRRNLTPKTDVGSAVAKALSSAGAELAVSLGGIAGDVGMKFATMAATDAINNNKNISDGTKKELTDLVSGASTHVNTTLKTVLEHTNNIAQSSILLNAGEISEEDHKADQAEAAALLAQKTSATAGALAQLALTAGGNIAKHEANIANIDNVYLKELATAGGNAASQFANTLGKVSNVALTEVGEEEAQKKFQDVNDLLDEAEAKYDSFVEDDEVTETVQGIGDLETAKADVQDLVQSVEDELINALAADALAAA